ncbi:MAG: APC family permease [Chloroflexi bacterium]|nr:MAG: APC family permease [Chloroflexota bacterium]TMC28825.1 MAG: APC family permease [Chloroflexota bacterium]
MSGLDRREEFQGRRPGDRHVRIVRPPEFRHTAAGLVATERALERRGGIGRAWSTIHRVLIGRRLATAEEEQERVSRKIGLAIFASDNISSSAYATEETMRVLALAGAGALALTMPLTIAICVVLAIVVLSYLQVIRAYPQGGGSYVVAKENLGVIPGLVAASALLVDYFLTVAVSVAAGVAAVTSAFPDLHPARVAISIALVAFLTIGNLRGIREAGLIFAAPTYLYVLSVLGLLGVGLLRVTSGAVPVAAAPLAAFANEGTQALTLLLVLRAFASGSVALTGTEAVSNGVQAFKDPPDRNASIVLVAMGSLFATLFVVISYLATTIGITPDASETETVLSLLARSLVGTSPYFYLVQATTAIILILAANTAFNGFPRLASIMATDRFMPRQFAQRGDRLAFSTGIVALAVVSSLLIVAYDASVTGLIPLYTVGVFIAFTLSQTGMVRRWLRLRSRGWLVSAAINALGAFATGVVAIVVGIGKFELGAWMVVAIIPVLVAMLYGINRHYRVIGDKLLIATSVPVRLRAATPRVIVPISRIDRPSLNALSIAKGLGGDIYAVHISFDADGANAFKRRWVAVVGDAIPLDTIISPYRALLPPLLRYIDAVDRGDPERPIIVVLAEFVPRHWWEALLHNQTALLLKLRLFTRRNTSVMDVPYHLDDADAGDDRRR